MMEVSTFLTRDRLQKASYHMVDVASNQKHIATIRITSDAGTVTLFVDEPEQCNAIANVLRDAARHLKRNNYGIMGKASEGDES